MNVKCGSEFPWLFVRCLEAKELMQTSEAERDWRGTQKGGQGTECPALAWILLPSCKVGEPLEVQGKRNDKA